MATVTAASAPAASSGVTSGAAASSVVPWWIRYTRWRQTSREEALAAEARLLSIRSGKCSVQVQDVRLPGEKTLHTYAAGGGPSDSTSAPPMVCLPGYGAGAGFYWKNLEALGRLRKVYAVDPLGTGLSSRPSFSATNVHEAEEFFIGALEQWHKAMGLEQMVLVGHSLGGYLATVYALKHPEHIKHLVLVSPAGIPEMPTDWEPEAVKSAMSVPGMLWRTAKSGWNSGITPGTVTRMLGPWGPSLVHRYVSGRFSHTGEGLSSVEIPAFRDYQYHILAQNGSGEHALRHLLQPFAWARLPLEHRIAELKVPVTFIYGDKDWMLNIDKEAPARAVERLEKSAPRASPRSAPLDREIIMLQNAGHYVFIDQPDKFNNIMESIYAGLA